MDWLTFSRWGCVPYASAFDESGLGDSLFVLCARGLLNIRGVGSQFWISVGSRYLCMEYSKLMFGVSDLSLVFLNLAFLIYHEGSVGCTRILNSNHNIYTRRTTPFICHFFFESLGGPLTPKMVYSNSRLHVNLAFKTLFH